MPSWIILRRRREPADSVHRRRIVVPARLGRSSRYPMRRGALWRRDVGNDVHDGCVRRALHSAAGLVLPSRFRDSCRHKLHDRCLLRRWRRCPTLVHRRGLLLPWWGVVAALRGVRTGFLRNIWGCEHVHRSDVQWSMRVHRWELLRARVISVHGCAMSRRPHMRRRRGAASSLPHRRLLVSDGVRCVQLVRIGVRGRIFWYRRRRITVLRRNVWGRLHVHAVKVLPRSEHLSKRHGVSSGLCLLVAGNGHCGAVHGGRVLVRSREHE